MPFLWGDPENAIFLYGGLENAIFLRGSIFCLGVKFWPILYRGSKQKTKLNRGVVCLENAVFNGVGEGS